MRKSLRLSFFILLYFNTPGVAADWDLFPINQKSYYQYYDPTWSLEKIDMVLMDSVYNSGNTLVMAFLRKYHGVSHGNCYEQLVSPPFQYFYPAALEMDSLVQVTDTVFYNAFYFLPHATVGSTWNIHTAAPLAGFQDLHVTCTTITADSVLGIPDTVKTYSFASYNGPNPYPSPFDSLQFKLSQHFGLLQYFPFQDVMNHQFRSYHRMVGLKAGATSSGFSVSYLQFVPYHPGDILNWMYVAACSTCVPPTIIYQRDSIKQVSFLPDTLSYHADRTTRYQNGSVYTDTNYVQKFPVDDLQNLYEAPTQWIAFASNCFGIGSYLPSAYEVYNSDSYVIDSSGSDTVINYSFRLWGKKVDTTNCNVLGVPDATYTLKINSKQGVTETCYDSWGPECTTLIGSVISGDTIGNIMLPVGLTEIPKSNSVDIYPNPVKEELHVINYSLSGITSIKVYNVIGEVLLEKKVAPGNREEKLGVSRFKAGMYFVKVFSENGSVTMKVIKE